MYTCLEKVGTKLSIFPVQGSKLGSSSTCAMRHRPISPREPCASDVKLASKGDKDARNCLSTQRNRTKKRGVEIESFDSEAAARRLSNAVFLLMRDAVRVHAR